MCKLPLDGLIVGFVSTGSKRDLRLAMPYCCRSYTLCFARCIPHSTFHIPHSIARRYCPPSHPAPEVLRWSTINARKQPVWSVAVLPDGQVATGGYDGAVQLLNRHTGDLTAELYQHSADTKAWLHTTSLAVSPGGRYLAAGSRDALVSVWTGVGSTANGGNGAAMFSAQNGEGEQGAAARPGQRASTPSHMIAATPVIATLRGHTDVVWAVAWSPDGTQLASASDDGTVRMWCAKEWRLIRTLIASRSAVDGGHRPGVRAIKIPIATENLLEDTDGRGRGGGHPISVPSGCQPAPSNYADVCYIDDVIAF